MVLRTRELHPTDDRLGPEERSEERWANGKWKFQIK
jgi:hypothetical protein